MPAPREQHQSTEDSGRCCHVFSNKRKCKAVMKAPPRQLTLAETLKAVEWSKQHQKEWSSLTRSKLRDACFADTGVILSDRKIQEIEEILGITRAKSRASAGNKSQQTIACELIRVMERIGCSPCDALTDIACGK